MQNILFNSGIDSNKLTYVTKQAITGDQVTLNMVSKNKMLIQSVGGKMKYIDLFNEAIPPEALKIRKESQRVHDSQRNQCWKAVQKLKDMEYRHPSL